MNRSRIHPSRLVAVLLLGALPLTAGCGGAPAEEGAASDAETRSDATVNVRTLTVGESSLSEFLTMTGPLRPANGTVVSSEESGVVAAIERDKGATVGRGETFIRLDRSLLAAEMSAADASAKLAVYNRDQSKELYEAKQISELEMLQTESNAAEASARASVARRRYHRAAVKAPFDGIVADTYVEVGELVAAGTPVGRIVNPYVLELRGTITEREVQWIRPDAEAIVTIAGNPKAYPGRVQWVSLEASPSSGKFEVEVRVENGDLGLRPGIVARAQILKDVHEDAIVIPRDAVVMTPAGPTAFVVRGDHAEVRSLQLGPDQGLLTSVTSGLRDGEELIVRGQRELSDGSLVTVQERATNPDGTLDSDPAAVRADHAFAPASGTTAANSEANR